MSIFGFRKKYRLVNRVRATIRVFIKHGLGYFIDRIFKESSLKIFRFHRTEPTGKYTNLTPAQRLRMVIEELGPTYIKIGQFFSTRADILPENFLKELSKLQDNVAPFPFEDVKVTIYEEFGKSVEDIFEDFSPAPIFSASISQVHLAQLKSGTWCIVKVRRPKIEEIVASDIEVLTEISKLISKHIPEIKQWHILNLLEDVGEHLKRQMDFIYEAGMMEKLKTFYEKTNIKVPSVFWQYTSKKILTMERIEGTKISDSSHATGDIPERLVKGLFQVIFETGYFHGDLHPGNIMLTNNGDIAFVDFGLVGYLNFEKRKQLAGILSGVLNAQLPDALPYMKKFLGITSKVPETFERDVIFIIDKYGSLPLKKIHLSDILYDLMKIARKMNIQLDSDIGLLAKNLMALESICAKINPSESLLNLSKSYWQPLLRKKIFQYLWLTDLKNLFQSYKNILVSIPENVEEIMQINRERVESEQQIVRRLDKYAKSLENVGNKISLSLIILPLISIFILLGIRIFSPIVFVLSLVAFLILVGIIFKIIAGKAE
ncbi:MAG TPA: AarF/UbiB family protein [bacterium]|nr:AarF/UbiB family protein [bacterium]